VIGLMITWALMLVCYDVRSGMKVLNSACSPRFTKAGQTAVLWPRWERGVLRSLTCFTLPLGLATTLVSLNTNIPRYFIGYYWGERELGIFAAIAYLMTVGGRVVNALGQAASPRLAKYYTEGNAASFHALLFKLLGLGLLLGGAVVLLALIAGQKILTYLYRPEYAKYGSAFVWLMVAAGMSYVASFLAYGVTATRAYHYLLTPYAITTLVAVGGSALLIPSNGVLGAAWTSCAVGFMSCIMPIIVLRKLMEKNL
jgi:O-antigen/teichoic acid export membrane protein